MHVASRSTGFDARSTLVMLPRSDHLVALDRERERAIALSHDFLLGRSGTFPNRRRNEAIFSKPVGSGRLNFRTHSEGRDGQFGRSS